jgi:RNA polymerase sigma factor (TIGR02999 family)
MDQDTGEDVGEITQLLHRWRDGSLEAEDELFRLVMPDLRRLARRFMSRERKDHSLQATELVDQIYFKLVAAKDRDWQSRQHFFAIAARAMRRYLIDYARVRPKVEFRSLAGVEGTLRAGGPKMEVVESVDKLLTELEATQPQLCSVVELKFFLGLTDQEAADALGLKLRTLQRKWQDARHWLFERLEPGNDKQPEKH